MHVVEVIRFEMALRLTKSSRGGDTLIFENHSFSKDSELKSGEIYWRCIKRNLKCSAKMYTIGCDLTVTRSDAVHNHEADKRSIERKLVTNMAKRKAEEDISEKPSKIIGNVLSSNLPEELTISDVNTIARNIYNCRRKVLPAPLPKNIDEVHQIVEEYLPKTSKGESFLFINSPAHSIIVFSCDTNIRLLSKMDTLYMDGTFSYCTKYFYQFLTIHGIQNGHYIPLLYCLLPNKTTSTYANLFSSIKSKLSQMGMSLEPFQVFIDFEKAIHSALLIIWPNVKINGCRFHFGKFNLLV